MMKGLLWRCWLRRNKINAEGQILSLEELKGQIMYWVNESLYACQTKAKQHEVVPKILKWQPPAGDLIKINIDGAYDVATRRGGWGFAARDSMGAIRGSGMGIIRYAASALQAEATGYILFIWGEFYRAILSNFYILYAFFVHICELVGC